MRLLGRAVTSLIACTAVSAGPTRDYTKHVALFIGTEGPVPGSAYSAGNVFPGATLPFGAVKVGIDTTRWNVSFAANAGYTPDGNVTAIAMLHESGTGGAPTYGLIPQMPLVTIEGVNLFDNLTYIASYPGG
ncbi:glycosyl hydrolase [Apiospora phragmitis]|uniref:Glycosyl hydrolase n=1 Tax=Apiospora phragmitis TaxID=2905665 RepID=A0ABR1SUE2_9PEZI